VPNWRYREGFGGISTGYRSEWNECEDVVDEIVEESAISKEPLGVVLVVPVDGVLGSLVENVSFEPRVRSVLGLSLV